MGFERVRREYGAPLLLLLCVALRCFFFLLSVVFFVFVRLVRVLWRMGARGAARRVNRGR